ncbi:hypothetical protein K504DRAFT_342496, partial [Pleomassaria siparia CBS 279.74]
LSFNDARILNALFDPESLPSSVAQSKDASAIDASLPPHPTISTAQIELLEQEQRDLIQRISAIEASADSAVAREAVLEEVLGEINVIVGKWPQYPSVYIQRAMVRRMQLEHMRSIFALPEELIEPLFSDLSHAIIIITTCSLPTSSPRTPPTTTTSPHIPPLPPPPSSPVSAFQARILRKAFSHRAYLHLLAASESGVEWKGLVGSELEELASRDFAEAARYGDETAREMSVRTNPYKKMCGAIVKNALREERRGEV